jgi:hypothetical protein
MGIIQHVKKNSFPGRQVRAGRWCLCVGCFLFCLVGHGQDFKRRYREGKDLFRQADYTRAMDVFKPLITYDKNNPYSEYASYYYGLSAYNLGFATVAKDMFIQTRKLYPDWDQIDEVSYLLAKIYFDQHEYFQGLLILNSIKNLSVASDVEGMKRNYLAQISDIETLKMIMEDYPEEPEGARALVTALAAVPIAQRDTLLLDSLIRKFQFRRENFIMDMPRQSAFKDRYSVSLLFPFLANTLDPVPDVKRNQFVLDLYQGMKQAVDTLRHQNITLDLLAYDTERDPDVTKKLLDGDELAATDLIVGPLFLEEAKILLPFSEHYSVNIINPVSSNSEFLNDDPFALLAQPSFETLGSKAAEFTASRVKNKNCIVYYSDSPKDSVEAFHFIKTAGEQGLRVVLAEEIHKETSAKILTTLTTATKFDDFKNPVEFALKRDSIGSIFVASDDPVIYTKAISAVETRGDSILIVGHENWIINAITSVDFGIYERLGIVLAAPNFSAITNPEYAAFRRQYLLKHGSLPSPYASLGYEFMIFVGHCLHQYGVYFQPKLSLAGVIRGTFGEGRYYPHTRDNQLVPFVQFKSGTLTVVDRK